MLCMLSVLLAVSGHHDCFSASLTSKIDPVLVIVLGPR